MNEQRGELDPTQGQKPAENVVSGPVAPSDDDLVPSNGDVEEVTRQDLERAGGLNAGGEFGHTPDHGDANASRLSADLESDGAGDEDDDEDE